MKRFASFIAGCVALGACTGPRPSSDPPRTADSLPVSPDDAAAPADGVDRSKLPAPGPTPQWTPPTPERFELANGMPVYFMPWGTTDLVTTLLVIPRGSATDPKGKSGLTALTLDLLDEGAGGKSALQLNRELQLLATDYGGGTDVDHISLYMNMLRSNFAPSIKLLADIAQRPSLSAGEFTRRKAQHIAGAISDLDNPGVARSVVTRKVLYGDGYAGQRSSGTKSSLEKLSYADVKAHYKQLVAPTGAALIVVGSIERGAVKAALDEAFGGWKTESKLAPAAVETAPAELGAYLVDFPKSTQSSLAVVKRARGEASPEYFAEQLFSRALGEAFTSRVNLNLREDKGYTYGARSSFERWKGAGTFGIYANVKTETTRASVDEVLQELSAVCQARPLSDVERSEAVSGLLLGLPGRFERINSVAGSFMTLPLYSRPLDWFAKYPDELRGVTKPQLNQVAKQQCDPKEYAIVIAGDIAVIAPTLAGLGRTLSQFDAEGRPVALKQPAPGAH